MIIGIEADHANKEKRSGVENSCYYLINALKKIIPKEHEVRLYSRAPLIPKLCDLPENWKSFVLPWRLKKAWSQIRLSRELKNNPPDIFFAPAQLVPFFTPRHTAVLVHDSAFLAFPKLYNFLSRVYLRWMNKRIVHVADKIFVTAKFNQQELQNNYSVDSENIFITPLGYDKDIFYPRSEEEILNLKNRYNIKKPYLLSVGRLETKKNTHLIIKAFDKIRESGKDVSLVLVGNFGKGVTGSSARLAYEDSKYRNDIQILSYVPLKDLPVFYSGALMFLFPSRYEGFGLPILEAMASGCPVITASNSAIPETAGDAAVLTKTNDLEEVVNIIEDFLHNTQLRQEFIEKGLKHTSEFSWERMGALIWRIFEKMLPKS